MARFSIKGLGDAIFSSGSRVHITSKGRVTVDGDIAGNVGGTAERPTVVEVRVLEGTLQELRSDMDLHVAAGVEVQGDVRAGMNATCGAVRGKVDAGMDARCGDVGGNVKAGMDANCGNVQGNVDAGMGVKMRKG